MTAHFQETLSEEINLDIKRLTESEQNSINTRETLRKTSQTETVVSHDGYLVSTAKKHFMCDKRQVSPLTQLHQRLA